MFDCANYEKVDKIWFDNQQEPYLMPDNQVLTKKPSPLSTTNDGQFNGSPFPENKPSFSEQFLLWLKLTRPKQWPKNLIAYAPLLFSEKAHYLPAFDEATLCVMALIAISAGVYIFNDIFDAAADRKHPRKQHRPLASGKLSKNKAVAFGACTLILGLTLSYFIRPTLALVCFLYLILNLTYAIVLKHHAILDVFGIAGGFVLRAIAGAVAISVLPSGWFLLCTSLGALFLALEKRRQELIILGFNSQTHRKSLDVYSPELLNRLEGLVLPALLVSYALYSFMAIHGHWMMLTVPFVLYGLMRYQQLSTEQKLTGAPEDVFWQDRPTQVAILLWFITCVLVVYKVPSSLASFCNTLDTLQIIN